MSALDNPLESIVLRESIRARTTVAPISVLATFLSIFMFVPLMVGQDVAYGRIALWTTPIILLVVARAYFSRRIEPRLEDVSTPQLVRTDRILRISSIVNQIMVGLGIWIIQSPSADQFLLPLFMTLIVVIWSIGVMANLFSDFPSFLISISFLIGETSVFWLSQGGIGISIGLSMLLAMTLMVLLVRQGTRIFRDSVLMRFEKDQLLQKVEIEQQKTQHALREAQTANDAKTFFMAAASHDIKQPLYALGIVTDTLLMSDPPQSLVSVLRTQRDSITQMSEHFDALMNMDKYQEGMFELTLSTFRLGIFSRRIDAEIAPLCANKNLRWKLDMEDVLISTDADLFLRLFRNLLSNAVRYTDEGQVGCCAKARGNVVEFVILDTGCGIAENQQGDVFKPFVRLDSPSIGDSGKGLGLSIVEKIDKALGLELQLSSTLGQGTQFSFRLPIADQE